MNNNKNFTQLGFKTAVIISTTTLLCAGANAKEGMYTPEQLPLIAEPLTQAGLQLSPQSLTSLTEFPMNAVVDLAGCSASFVSKKGLVVTNHHCARGSVQFNSTAENNYLENGFLAATLQEELPAAPGTRILVTVDFSDVTSQVLAGTQTLAGKARYDVIEANRKSLISECEAEAGFRCKVPAFYAGKEYKLIKQMEIRDVRIAYSPADAIGKYGGDIDNWMWPRHTGDFAFYRAYVSPQGKPADYDKDNVPFVPKHTLDISIKPLKEGDFVMAAGYPGSTNRYARASQVEYRFDWFYPTYIDIVDNWIQAIEDAAPKGSDARVKYESRLAGLNNYLKNTKGQISGAKRVNLLERRIDREIELENWLTQQPNRRDMLTATRSLDQLLNQKAESSKRQVWYDNAQRSQLLQTAKTLYKLAVEKQKPDAERDFGFQNRDLSRLEQRLMRLDRRFDIAVDKAEWTYFLNRYLALPESQRGTALDNAFAPKGSAVLPLSDRLDDYYRQTVLTDVDTRLQLLSASKEALDAHTDPFIQLAAALYPEQDRLQNEAEALEGEIQALQPDYMDAVIAWQASMGQVAYPDANSTLRVTYGQVLGGSPQDGLIYEPFTRVEGIVQKDTGDAPFNSPAKQLELIKAKTYGEYRDPLLDTVPVNFLTDLDSTGGNSGSATLNAQGELVGLLFDGTIESVNSDWDFDTRTTRTIHVDTRYMLWIMQYVDGATNLIDEMSIKK